MPTDASDPLRQELLRAVRDNLLDGASHLARIALDALSTYAERAADDDVEALRQSLLAFASDLGATRPSMTAIHNLVARWQQGVANFSGDITALRTYAIQQAREVRTWADAATHATVRAAASQIAAGSRLLLHSSSSTVGKVLERLPAASFSVVVTEARPGLEGWNVAAALASRGVRVTYITDAQVGIFIEQVDCVLLGADSILIDGTLVNKAGSRLIALAAREAGVPVLVVAESFKCTGLSAQTVELEEKSGSELRPPPVPGVHARNVYFDLTPAHLITAYVSNEAIAERFVSVS